MSLKIIAFDCVHQSSIGLNQETSIDISTWKRLTMALEPIHNESEILEKLAGGDEGAFSELFYAYHNQLAEFVMLITQQKQLAEDIVQDVFAKIWQSRTGLASVEKFTSYLFVLTRNYTLNCIRKLETSKKHQQQYSLLAQQPETAYDTSVDNYLPIIDRAIAQLPPQQQKVFLLSRRDGLRHNDIAHSMGISRETVKKYIQLANLSVTEFVSSHQEMVVLLAVGGFAAHH